MDQRTSLVSDPANAVVDGAPLIGATDRAGVGSDFDRVRVLALRVNRLGDALGIVAVLDLDTVGAAKNGVRAVHADREILVVCSTVKADAQRRTVEANGHAFDGVLYMWKVRKGIDVENVIYTARC